MTEREDRREQLNAALELAGVAPPPEDLEALEATFRSHRERAALLFAVEAARYEEPALVYRARP